MTEDQEFAGQAVLLAGWGKAVTKNVWKENMALDAQTFAAIASIVHATMRLASAS